MAQKGGLGRGFGSLFMENSPETGQDGAVTLRISDIEPDPEQPRRVFDSSELDSLAESISEHGVITPILVRPMTDGSYRIIAGERRWRAARQAGLKEIPAIVRSVTDSEAAQLALVENLQREDLNPVEEAQGIRRLIEEFDFTHEDAAKSIGRSRAAVTNSLRLLNLPEEPLRLVEIGALTAGHARALLSLGSEDEINAAAREIVDRELSVRET
nr:ParB/RepB/Spo0J family partition protein [Clostridia bacterium]